MVIPRIPHYSCVWDTVEAYSRLLDGRQFPTSCPVESQFYGDDFSEKQRRLPAVLPKLNRHNCRKLDQLISHRRELNSHITGDSLQSHSSSMKPYQPIRLHL